MVDAQLPALTKWPTNKLALAQLTPETASAAAFLEGVVSLQWPFSPSSATLSLLVCEEDFRLRSNRGQLRVDFHGPSAKAVDDMGVQIGDRVQLSLEGAGLELLDTATAGDVPWAVVFSTRLAMQVGLRAVGKGDPPLTTEPVQKHRQLGPHRCRRPRPRRSLLCSYEPPGPSHLHPHLAPPHPSTSHPAAATAATAASGGLVGRL